MKQNWNNLDLTDRQREIAELVLHWVSEKDIANALDLSVYTVNKTKHIICQKTDMDWRELHALYFGVDPSNDPILRYDFRPRLSNGKKVGAVMMVIIFFMSLFQLDHQPIRHDRERVSNQARISRLRVRRNEFLLLDDFDLNEFPFIDTNNQLIRV